MRFDWSVSPESIQEGRGRMQLTLMSLMSEESKELLSKKKKKTSFQDLNLRKRSRTRGKTTWMKYWNVFGRLLKIGCGLLPSESYQSVPLVRGALVFKPLLLQPRQLQLLFLQLWPWLPTQTTSTFAFSWWDYYCTTALVYTTAFFFWQGNLKTH